jgi:phosphate transport system substrate-binding protein
MFVRFVIAGFVALVAVPPSAEGIEWISIRGAQVASEPVNAAAERIRKEADLDFTVATDGGSSAAIDAIGEDFLDVALLSRPISQREHASYPNSKFFETRFGMQALLIVVPEQVWNSGVHAVTKEQLRDIYEGKLTNWKAIGGEDRKITFFYRDIARNQWELLMSFLYEDIRKAPLSNAEVVAEPGDVTSAVEFNGGSISVLEFSAPRSARIHALGIKLADGTVVEPTGANIASGRYGLARPLIVATSKKPAGRARRFIDFMLGPVGQEFVKKSGHVPNSELGNDKPPQEESR